MRGVLLLSLVALLAGGCVPAFPSSATRAVDRSLTLGALRSAPESRVGRQVILAGEVVATRPKPGETEIEVLGRDLEWDDGPERSDRSDGRFLARTPDFLDPAVFSTGRRVTILGTVAGAEERALGDLPYRFPVIAMERIRLWPRDPPPYVYPDPFWPYYPWGYVPWPYYPYRRYRH